MAGAARSAAAAFTARARRSDAMVVAAALTCYAVLGVVPLLAIATRTAAWWFGRAEVVRAVDDLASYLRDPLGLDRNVTSFGRSAVATPWWTAVVALVPVSLWSEGTVRCLERFSIAPERRSRTVRGRLLTPVLVVAAVAAVTAVVGLLRPLLAGSFGTGVGPQLLGLFVAFVLLFAFAFAVLVAAYRLFATTPLGPFPLSVAAFCAGSWLAGQTLGYVGALRLVHGFANAFGGDAAVGVTAALVFLTYLQCLVFVAGYVLALTVHERCPTLGAARARVAERSTQRP